MSKTRNILPGIITYPERKEEWLLDLREQRKIRPLRKKRKPTTTKKKKKPILTKTQKDKLSLLSPEMRAALGI